MYTCIYIYIYIYVYILILYMLSIVYAFCQYVCWSSQISFCFGFPPFAAGAKLYRFHIVPPFPYTLMCPRRPYTLNFSFPPPLVMGLLDFPPSFFPPPPPLTTPLHSSRSSLSTGTPSRPQLDGLLLLPSAPPPRSSLSTRTPSRPLLL